MEKINTKSSSQGVRLSHATWPMLRCLIQAKGRLWLEKIIAREHSKLGKKMTGTLSYSDFIASKKHSTGNFGFEHVWMPESAFDFQKHVISKAVQKGRIGMFADTGLGKTLLQLAIAENMIRYTNKRVLILTPLAVAFQFIDEAARIGVDDISHSKDGTLTHKITVCNYERLHLLNPDDFVCVMCDESSILKNFAGKTRDAIVAFIKRP